MGLPGNVLFVVTLRADLTISGLAYRLMAVWRHLYEQEENGKVFLVTTRSLWKKMYGDVPPNVKYVFTINDQKNYKRKAFLLPFAVTRILIRHRIKILHTNGNYLLLPVHYLKKPLGIRTVVTFGSANLEMASGYSKFARKLWKFVLNAATAVDVLNPVNTIDNYHSRKFVSPCSFPYSVDSLNIDGDSSVEKSESLTFIGSFTPQKNPLLAVQAFGVYLEGHNNSRAVLEMYGDGPQKEEAWRIADKINRREGRIAVNIHDRDGDRYEKLKKSRIFLSLQDYTNYPSQSLMEAMVLGNSIIATDFGDTNNMVVPHNGNILVAEKDPKLIGNAIEQLLKRTIQFNQKNANFIQKNHNIYRFTQYLNTLYQQIL